MSEDFDGVGSQQNEVSDHTYYHANASTNSRVDVIAQLDQRC
jgi:hypothetical protein